MYVYYVRSGRKADYIKKRIFPYKLVSKSSKTIFTDYRLVLMTEKNILKVILNFGVSIS
jgi:hypothetical protein